jgi:hypothetical protein
VREATEGQQSVRAARCSNHPAVAAVGSCDVCGKPICLSCAIPVRERLVCHDDIPNVLADVPAPARPPDRLPAPGWGDRLALAGFGLVTVLSIFPWTRFGDHSGYLEAWTPHWSLIAAATAMAAGALATWVWRHPVDAWVTAAAYVAAALVVVAAVELHRRNPPGAPLATASGISRLAILGAAVALVGGLVKAGSVARLARAPGASSGSQFTGRRRRTQ